MAETAAYLGRFGKSFGPLKYDNLFPILRTYRIHQYHGIYRNLHRAGHTLCHRTLYNSLFHRMTNIDVLVAVQS